MEMFSLSRLNLNHNLMVRSMILPALFIGGGIAYGVYKYQNHEKKDVLNIGNKVLLISDLLHLRKELKRLETTSQDVDITVEQANLPHTLAAALPQPVDLSGVDTYPVRENRRAEYRKNTKAANLYYVSKDIPLEAIIDQYHSLLINEAHTEYILTYAYQKSLNAFYLGNTYDKSYVKMLAFPLD